MVRSEVLILMTVKMAVPWDVALYNIIFSEESAASILR
jgi:hypothetical protein